MYSIHILTHRIVENKYEFNIKIPNSNSVSWVSENYLLRNDKATLDLYKKKNNLINKTSNLDEEFGNVDYSKHIALEFNKQFGIKLQVGIAEYESELAETEENLLKDNTPPDGAPLANQSINVKLENVEPGDINMTENNEETVKGSIAGKVYKKECTNNEQSLVINNVKTIELNGSTEVDVAKNGQMDMAENDNCRSVHNHRKLLEKNDSNKEKPMAESNTHDASYRQELLKKSLTIKVKKATKSSAEIRKPEEQKTARCLLTIESTENNLDSVDEMFLRLPVANKIAFDVRSESNKGLTPITSRLLKSIVEKGDIDLLQIYMFSESRDELQRILQSNAWIFVLAAQRNQIHMIAAFLSLGVNINGVDSSSYTALMRACDNENDALIDLLINNGAAMNIKRNGSNNVMFHCVTKNKIRAIGTLLNLGADFGQIQLDPPISLESYAKQMKLDEISKVIAKHNSYLSKAISDNVLSQLGPNIKIIEQIMAFHVLSLFEIQDETIQLTFDADIPPVRPNHCSLLFLLTGLVLGTGMKCLMNDTHNIRSVILNDVKQQSLIPGLSNVTSFSPLKGEKNTLIINSERVKCRKIRLILVAYNIMIVD